MSQSKKFGLYCSDLQVAYDRAGLLAWLIAAGWLLFPTALLTVIHPSDAIGLQYYLSGQRVPHSFTSDQLVTGEIISLAVLAVLSALLFGMMVTFYRKAGFSVMLWPPALMLVAVVGNGFWWFHSGYFDLLGFLAGCASMAITVVCEAAFVKRGQDLAFGENVRPQYQGW
jgi:hypothetical protein